MRSGDVTGPYRGGEAIYHVVGDLDRLVDCFEGDGRQHRAEDLLARDRHGRPDALEHRRLDEVTAAVLAHPAVADADAGSVAAGGRDVTHRPFHLRLVDYRAALGPKIKRIAGLAVAAELLHFVQP